MRLPWLQVLGDFLAHAEQNRNDSWGQVVLAAVGLHRWAQAMNARSGIAADARDGSGWLGRQVEEFLHCSMLSVRCVLFAILMMRIVVALAAIGE